MKLCEEMRLVWTVVKWLLLSKAFDCFHYDIMATKPIEYGMSHPTMKFLINYLRHHKQHAKIWSDTRDWMAILKCIPQGSILGFNLFFNDFMYILKHTLAVKYVDDNILGSRVDAL